MKKLLIAAVFILTPLSSFSAEKSAVDFKILDNKTISQTADVLNKTAEKEMENISEKSKGIKEIFDDFIAKQLALFDKHFGNNDEKAKAELDNIKQKASNLSKTLEKMNKE